MNESGRISHSEGAVLGDSELILREKGIESDAVPMGTALPLGEPRPERHCVVVILGPASRGASETKVAPNRQGRMGLAVTHLKP